MFNFTEIDFRPLESNKTQLNELYFTIMKYSNNFLKFQFYFFLYFLEGWHPIDNIMNKHLTRDIFNFLWECFGDPV